MTRVGLVIVSHSQRIADGIVELALQMAPSVDIRAAGGTDDGALGTSFAKVTAAIDAADGGRGAVILCDLGSAVLTAETARDFLPSPRRDRVRIVDAPIVEGAVAAAVASEIGGDLDAVSAAATTSTRTDAPVSPQPAVARTAEAYVRTVTLTNADGLHARPAAEFVKLAGTFPARITVNGTDAKSLLGIMSLGLLKGATVDIASTPDAHEAVDALADLVETSFGEKPR
jgi:PTS hybrid protein